MSRIKYIKNCEDKMFLSEVGFEPTPSHEDQKSLHYPLSREQGMYLESGALDHSAILTGLLEMGKVINGSYLS